MENATKRCGTIAIVGRPNVGKSTMLNSLVGEKVAIVSPKPQTTRNRIVGVVTDEKRNAQFIFMDTPGLHASRDKLGDVMNRAIFDTAEGVDAAILVIAPPDGKPAFVGKQEHMLIDRLKKSKIPTILAINKTDAMDKPAILPWIAAYAPEGFTEIVPVSAKTGDGLQELLDCAAKLIPESDEFTFPDDEYTDQPERFMASELVREKLLLHLDKEIPHGVMCVTEQWLDREDGVAEVSVAITCERQNHKGIIIGKGGAMLKTVGTEARTDMEKTFGCKVFLNLWVKVREDWKNSDALLRDALPREE